MCISQFKFSVNKCFVERNEGACWWEKKGKTSDGLSIRIARAISSFIREPALFTSDYLFYFERFPWLYTTHKIQVISRFISPKLKIKTVWDIVKVTTFTRRFTWTSQSERKDNKLLVLWFKFDLSVYCDQKKKRYHDCITFHHLLWYTSSMQFILL